MGMVKPGSEVSNLSLDQYLFGYYLIVMGVEKPESKVSNLSLDQYLFGYYLIVMGMVKPGSEVSNLSHLTPRLRDAGPVIPS
jgi:hypothetical protein